MIAWILAAALSAASPPLDLAGGFSTADLARANPNANLPTKAAAMAHVQGVRAALILNPGQGLARLDPMEGRALARALGRLDGTGAAPVAWFMRGAVVRIGIVADGPVAGFYNPLIDAWLIAPMSQIGGEFRITRAVLVEGRAGASPWTEAPNNSFGTLIDNYRSAMGDFDARYRRGGSATAASGDAFVLVGERTAAWMTSLGRWRAGTAGVTAARSASEAIAQGRTASSGLGDPAVAAQVDGLAASTRQGFSVTGAVRRGDKTSLLLISPGRPDLILVLDLDAANRPAGLAIINLGNALPEEAGA